MSSGVNDPLRAANGKKNFGLLAQEVFSLDDAIQWVALEEAGREPRWAWRDPETGSLLAGTTTCDAAPDDPLKLMLAKEGDDLYSHEASTNSHHLLFVVLAYADLVQIVARFGPAAQVSVATDRSVDMYTLGTRLANLLHRSVQVPLLQ
jgi:hypothetical protein